MGFRALNTFISGNSYVILMKSRTGTFKPLVAGAHELSRVTHGLAVQVSAPRRTPLRVQNIRVNNVEIPNNKRIEISLQYIFGVGQTTAQAILRDTVSGLSSLTHDLR